MPIVIGVRFRDAGRRLYVNPHELQVKENDTVMVSTNRGVEYATVCEPARDLPDNLLPSPLMSVQRLATTQDLERIQSNREKEEQAFAICKERILAHKLDMKLVSVEYTFDNSKLIACFTSGGRVDFRALVKDLAGIFKTRIELKQIGVRDEARIIGGMGSGWGTLLGGIILGLAQTLGAQAFGSAWSILVGHVVFVAILAFRPQGFLAKTVTA